MVPKLSLLMVMATATTTITTTTALTTEMTGYLMDNKCLEICLESDGTPKTTGCTPDGSNAYYSPEFHTGWCLLLPVCDESGYSLMSMEPDENGMHSPILSLTGDTLHAAVVEYINKTNYMDLSFDKKVAFPMVTVAYDHMAVGVASDGAVPQVMEATIRDTWPVIYTGSSKTPTGVCDSASDASVEGNNMCFRNNVFVSTSDAKGMFVIESGGCPDHVNMSGGSGGVVADNNVLPALEGGGSSEPGCTGCGGCTGCTGGDKCGGCGVECCAGECYGCTGVCEGKADKECCAGGCGGCGGNRDFLLGLQCDGQCSGACGTCGGCIGCGVEDCCAGNKCDVCGVEDCCAGNKCDVCGGSSKTPATGTFDPMHQHYTLLIPQDAGTPGEAKPITDNVVGIMINGVILDSHEQTWSYDQCNGHSDRKHQYHYHTPPTCFLESMGFEVPESPTWWMKEGMATMENGICGAGFQRGLECAACGACGAKCASCTGACGGCGGCAVPTLYNEDCQGCDSQGCCGTKDCCSSKGCCGTKNCCANVGDSTPDCTCGSKATVAGEVRPYDEMAAQWPSMGKSPVVGWARDGFPIKALYDKSGALQRSQLFGGDLDECNGKDDGTGYAYYLTAEPPFAPPCLKGTIGPFSYAPSTIACPKKGIMKIASNPPSTTDPTDPGTTDPTDPSGTTDPTDGESGSVATSIVTPVVAAAAVAFLV